MATAAIDLWDPASFDPALIGHLDAGADILRAYVETGLRIDEDYEANPRQMIRESNPHWDAFEGLRQSLEALLRQRVARAWHYTRLTDDDAAVIKEYGVSLSTAAAFRRRLDALVEARLLTSTQADAIFAASVLNGSQKAQRLGQFCMTAYPLPLDDWGIQPLVKRWGGEVAAFHLQDDDLRALLATIGPPRVFELAAPLANVKQDTAHGVLAAHGLGVAFGRVMPELFSTKPLGPECLLALHSEGEGAYQGVGHAYPQRLAGSFGERLIVRG